MELWRNRWCRCWLAMRAHIEKRLHFRELMNVRILPRDASFISRKTPQLTEWFYPHNLAGLPSEDFHKKIRRLMRIMPTNSCGGSGQNLFQSSPSNKPGLFYMNIANTLIPQRNIVISHTAHKISSDWFWCPVFEASEASFSSGISGTFDCVVGNT